ncbi:GNAT family N-acetyltransferase [Atopobacter phocae]|uniref:GNAT family N-acetyltransferase n=1 Tax=Atopobacter phocae TaxID=136492 RepID=UPI00046FDD35|nr:GNAT family N-acetyltransferase [Atopobacter phocae]
MILKIRRMTKNDLTPLHQLLSDEKVMKYIEPPFTFQQTESFLMNMGMGDIPLIYSVDDENEKFIGYVIYHDYDHESMEIGWLLKRSEWGKGYATQLTQQLIEKVSNAGKNIILEFDKRQTASKSIALKFGFEYQGNREGLEVYLLKPKL